MNKHEKKMLAAITAANDAGNACRSPGHYAVEYTALDKLQAAGTIMNVPSTTVSQSGYVVAGHPMTRTPKFNAAVCDALRDKESILRQAQRDIAVFEKILGRNV